MDGIWDFSRFICWVYGPYRAVYKNTRTEFVI